MQPKKKRLGRGLEALLNSTQLEQEVINSTSDPAASETEPPGVSSPTSSKSSAAAMSSGSGVPGHDGPPNTTSPRPNGSQSNLLQLSVYEIDDNPFQPRREFNEPEIAALAESLKEHDMLQPILVRRQGDRYQLISGERRLRAAIAAGWSTIPARLRQADDRLVAELAIVENLQRKDLNAIEKALSFRRYIDEHECTQEDLANRLKIDRSTLTNLIRLLDLPATVQDALRDNRLTAGHARALLPLGDEHVQLDYSRRIQQEGWSVRKAEREVNEFLTRESGAERKRPGKRRTPNPQVESLQQQLKMALGTKVEIKQSAKNKGKIVIHFTNAAEFDRLNQLLGGENTIRRAG